MLSASIGAATGTFVGTDVSFSDNILLPAFGVTEAVVSSDRISSPIASRAAGLAHRGGLPPGLPDGPRGGRRSHAMAPTGSDAAPRQPESEADTHNADTFGEAAQNESIDDATNDEVRGMQLPGSAPLRAAAATALPAAQLGE